MKAYNLNNFYYVTDVNDYEKHNKEILSLIDKMPQMNRYEESEIINKSDWGLPKDYDRPYLEYFYKIVGPYMDKMCYFLNCRYVQIHNGWYNQYIKNDKHNWHNHPNCQFTNVYFVELPEQNLVTQLYDFVNNKVIDTIEIKEGQILSFPSNIIHRSDRNTTDKRKTIISFNTSFDGVISKNIDDLIEGKK